MVDAADFACPYGIIAETAPAIQAEALAKLPGAKEQAEAAAKRKAEMEEKGRKAWAAFHAKAVRNEITPKWLHGEFSAMIPRFGCSCLREWNEILAKAPPLPKTGQAQWAEDRHDDVNAKLGKPVWKHLTSDAPDPAPSTPPPGPSPASSAARPAA